MGRGTGLLVLNQQAVNGNSASFKFKEGPRYGTGGGIATMVAYDTWDTATVKLQLSPDAGTTWIDADTTNLSFTANGAGNFHAAGGSDLLYRVNVSSAGAGTLIDCKIYGGAELA